MQLLELILIILQLSNIYGRKKYKEKSSSEESIENILYYKDCNHKKKTPDAELLRKPVELPQKPQECKMSCTMCCGGECVNHDQTLPGSSPMNERTIIEPMSVQVPPMSRPSDGPIQPILRPRKKKLKPSLLPPIGGRRDFGFTRENIKNLISQDEDIKKILKDLVKVTMQKVDLVQMINARRQQINGSEEPADGDENNEDL